MVDVGENLTSELFVEAEGNQKDPKKSTTMLNWMKWEKGKKYF